MKIGDVMRVRVVNVSPEATVAEAVARMVEERIGAVAVCEGGRLVGILSERDVLRLADEGGSFRQRPVGEVMTSRVVTVAPEVGIVEAAALMGERQIRHLPVVEEDRLLGIVSMREVMRLLVERCWDGRDAAAHETAQRLLVASR